MSNPSAMRLRAWVTLALLFASSTAQECSNNKRADEFSWDSIQPSATLKWTPCFEEPLQCARLEVPLDYSKPSGDKVALALLKYPSKYRVGDKKYRGPVLYNPGGPGASGVLFVRGSGADFSKIIGDDYDHIGFDPRGLGATTPSLQVFSSRAESKLFTVNTPLTLNSTPADLPRLYGYGQILGDLVEERAEAARVATHMTTTFVARDLLSITRAHGREKLLYWGLSYGTVLGITFASLFPNNIERMIVDGVADTENYYAGLWSNNLRDTDAGLHQVLVECSQSSSCPLHESTPEAVGSRVDSIIAELHRSPLVVNDGQGFYGLSGADLAHKLLFEALYKPAGTGPEGMDALFKALSAAQKGDGLPLLQIGGRRDSTWRCPGDCGGEPEPEPIFRQEVHVAIACGDGDVIKYDGIDGLKAHYEELRTTSQFADMWDTHTYCAGWKVRPVERFHGPFLGNTSFPMLFIGNTLDPVTPLWAAKKMSTGFKKAVVLTQNSPGHCTIAASSLCIAKNIRAYFRDGVLPKPDTICEVEDKVWVADAAASKETGMDQVTSGIGNEKTDASILSLEDQETLAGIRGASRRWLARSPVA